MTITPNTIYWITRLDGLVASFVFFAIIAGIGILFSGAFFFFMIMEGEEKTNDRYRYLRRLFVGFIIGFFISWAGATFIPSSKEAAAIQIIPKIVNCEKIQNISNKAFDLAIDWLEDLKGKNHE